MTEKSTPFSRYSRQIFIEEIGVAGQRRIMQSKILVVGAGGLGSPVIQYLAAAGVGTLGMVDFDVLEEHNLNRQIIHRTADIGSAKVDSAARFVRELNPLINIETHSVKLDDSNAKNLILDYDVVVDGSDNFTTRYLVNDVCVALNKPIIYGSIFGFEGQVAVFNYNGGKQLRDLFPEPPTAEDIPDCDSNGVLGALPGIIGSMMAMLALKVIIGLPVDTNQLTIVDTMQWNFTKINF
ncbi:HesA/MoeB/ThiF family protein [Sphingobacterium sp. lm-10]|uniref:HesA/MoeB/ThiF family protein n=1 Tax=Sphingobacterium sp. lm-10 TaxID=2944904 RepID=UPI0020212A47|nr:HesA/MoeB/ThiF family protein [Sphingobacterium sp. lm-10]MCL7987463.1 HesA/MoeB/ThiF family protein [Sphingobacterium sp. lm-10]